MEKLPSIGELLFFNQIINKRDALVVVIDGQIMLCRNLYLYLAGSFRIALGAALSAMEEEGYATEELFGCCSKHAKPALFLKYGTMLEKYAFFTQEGFLKSFASKFINLHWSGDANYILETLRAHGIECLWEGKKDDCIRVSVKSFLPKIELRFKS